MILKAIAWAWLVIVFVTLTGLSLWQVITNFAGAGGFAGFLWLSMIFMLSIVWAAAVVSYQDKK